MPTVPPSTRLPGLLLAVALAACSPAPPPAGSGSQPAAVDALDAATGAILRGNAAEATAALRVVPETAFAGVDAGHRACILARLDRDTPPPAETGLQDPFADAVLAAYQRYWWWALTTPERRTAHEDALRAELLALLAPDDRGITGGGDDGDWSGLEARLIEALRARGLHALAGTTAPLRELMLWREERIREETIELPDGIHTVRTHYLDDFASLGWSAYGVCGRRSTGGWATEAGLFAVVPAYDRHGGLDSEAFEVVFRGHEAQHFADKHRFGSMAGWEYEYRAKLVELVQGEAIGDDRLAGFATAQGDDPGAPHPYANRRVLQALAQRLGQDPATAPRRARQAAALDLLREDSARREAGSARASSAGTVPH